MDILEAKLAVIAAGKRLVQTGLIARTWGNVSARVDEHSFVITPSGRAYETLTPDEIVLVNIADLSYSGAVKPSSEKGIHAQAYLLRPAVHFVIHTHQRNASIVAAARQEIPEVDERYAGILGRIVPLASYGLPGTGKLRKGVVAALLGCPDGNAVLMAHHGALCVGRDAEEAFRVADTLELACAAFLRKKFGEIAGKAADRLEDVHAAVAAGRAALQKREPAKEVKAYASFRSGGVFCMKPEAAGPADGEVDVCIQDGKVTNGAANYPDTLELHRAIYRRNSKINAIVHTKQPDILRVSAGGPKRLPPLLDDFAQIAGINLRLGRFDPNNTLETAARAARKLSRRSAMLLEDNGALCVGSSEDEARAVETVVEKNCAASLSADLFGKVNPIGRLDAALMRLIYVKKYSKKKEEK
ncbi:MAG: class II aldolase/adducin family protein [Oscillospiraceae bacterium]|jgi:L-fuculose-phosphate aldolase|nr:class II aldolase/adducin family protein [Oscillospiraceae bacterium]